MHVLVTGAAGFVGRHLLKALKARGHQVTALARGRTEDVNADHVVVAELTPGRNWRGLFDGVDAVIHLADGLRAFEGLKHSPGQAAEDEVVAMSLNLARAAQAAGVSRFIYLSSIKAAAGEQADSILVETDAPSPTRPLYGVLKARIEAELLELAAGGKMNVMALRSPIVYGPGGGGNFLKLIHLADSAWPLPFGGIDNRRSLIAIANLCDALCLAAELEAGPPVIYFVHDGKPVSISWLIGCLRGFLGRPAHLFVVSRFLWLIAERLPFLRAKLSRLTGSLELSDEKFRRDYGWQSVVTTEAALHELVETYRQVS